MERTSLTRQELLGLKVQRDSISKGLQLLKSKREALMKEFFGAVEENVRMRTQLADLFGRAQRRLEVAKATGGVSALNSFAHSAKRDVALNITVRNVWGVTVPEIEEQALVRTLDARDASPIGEKAEFFDVARDFEAVADLIVRIASMEVRLSRTGEMIKSDTRKINAISEVMLPAMRKKIKTIGRVLEEREREEVFRLKRFKERRG
ncbi:MAG: hypothetical protein BMS9Abin23_0498 [Thermodesulfobacteriota bacterium]|nr:MAG: hypothetical protein BMS9Abin23_0498 [Thermodesulfobacteriota bacterium]